MYFFKIYLMIFFFGKSSWLFDSRDSSNSFPHCPRSITSFCHNHPSGLSVMSICSSVTSVCHIRPSCQTVTSVLHVRLSHPSREVLPSIRSVRLLGPSVTSVHHIRPSCLFVMSFRHVSPSCLQVTSVRHVRLSHLSVMSVHHKVRICTIRSHLLLKCDQLFALQFFARMETILKPRVRAIFKYYFQNR